MRLFCDGVTFIKKVEYRILFCWKNRLFSLKLYTKNKYGIINTENLIGIDFMSAISYNNID